MMRVLLVDDHSLVRAGIRRLLEEMPDIFVVGEAADGEEAIDWIERERPDVVLADISMPRMNGLELSSWLAKTHPQIKSIILSMHAAEDFVIQALDAGARGYLLKDSATVEINLALNAVASGEVYLSHSISRHMVNAYLQRPANGGFASSRITARQREVLKLVALGRSSKEIGGILRISPRTVEAHRAELMNRLNARDAISLVREAARLGLVDIDAAR